jgi:RecJ-like exonuclease
MMLMKENFSFLLSEAEKAKIWIEETREQIRVVSHYDADGICSAAIMIKTLMRMNKSFHLSIIKQLSRKFLEKLSEERRKLVIFLDMGSGQIEMIKKLLPSRVIICDHHQTKGEKNENIVHINPSLIGIDDEISGAGVTYILAKTIDTNNIDLAYLAVIGALGDSQIDAIGYDWGLAGMNKEILKDAEKGKIKVSKGLRLWGRYTRPIHKALAYSIDPFIPGVSGSESASVQFLHELGIEIKKDGKWRTIGDLTLEEQKKLADGIIKERIAAKHENPEYIFGDVYEIVGNENEFRDANEFATILNACGKMDSAHTGIAFCFNDKKIFGKVKEMLEVYRKEIGKGVSWVYSNLNNEEVVKNLNGVYILAGENISEHLISNVISIINHSCIFPEKPLFGIADSEDGIKISARANDELVKKGIKLNEVMSIIAEKLGGEGGGHMAAAAAIIPKEKREEFINMTELILTNISGVKYGHEGQTEVERRAEGDEGDKNRGSEARRGRRKDSGKKVEGKGLVQYFVS